MGSPLLYPKREIIADDISNLPIYERISKRSAADPEVVFDSEESEVIYKRSIDDPSRKQYKTTFEIRRIGDLEENAAGADKRPTKFPLRRKKSLSKHELRRRFAQDSYTGGFHLEPWMGRL